MRAANAGDRSANFHPARRRARARINELMARKSKLKLMSEEDKAAMIRALRAGTPAKYACQAVGISWKTLSNWRERAEEGEEPYASFISEVERAEGQWVVETMTILDVDGKGLPPGKMGDGQQRERSRERILTWKLEKLHPKDFAPLQKTEVTGKDGAPLAVTDWQAPLFAKLAQVRESLEGETEQEPEEGGSAAPEEPK